MFKSNHKGYYLSYHILHRLGFFVHSGKLSKLNQILLNMKFLCLLLFLLLSFQGLPNRSHRHFEPILAATGLPAGCLLQQTELVSGWLKTSWW